RVVDRVHRHAAHARPPALPPAPAGLPKLDVALLGVAYLADGRPAGRVHQPDFTRGHPQVGLAGFLGEQLDPRAGRPGNLGPAAGPKFDRVHDGAGRDRAQRQAVAGLDVRAVTVLHDVALPQASWREDVALGAVRVVQQRDSGGPVRVVLDV